MAYTRTKYEDNFGEIHAIRLNSKTAAVTGNAAPTGAVSSSIKAKVSKNNREHGLRPRIAVLAREISAGGGDGGGETITATKYARIPVLTQAVWDGNAFKEDQSITYAGSTWKVVGRLAEDY